MNLSSRIPGNIDIPVRLLARAAKRFLEYTTQHRGLPFPQDHDALKVGHTPDPQRQEKKFPPFRNNFLACPLTARSLI